MLHVLNEMTDGYLAASIVNPSYKLAPYPKELIMAGGNSRMPEYADRMTVRRGSPKYLYYPRGNPGGALRSVKTATIVFEMDKGRHPKVVRTWMTGKTRKPPLIPKVAPVAPHKPQPHNKT